MKITDITGYPVWGGFRNYFFLVIDTDEGIYGVGEGGIPSRELASMALIEHLKPLLIGEDPFRIEHLWQKLWRCGFFPAEGLLSAVISAIDIALWDIKGKALGVPVYELLGGRVRDKVRMYTHFGGATPEALAANARAKVERGWTAIKTVPVPITNMVDGPRKLRQAEEGLRAVREAVGEDVDILLDLHGRLTPQMAIQYGKRFEQYAPFFLEEPVPAENPAAMAPVARALSTPIATGERLFLRWGFRELLDAGAASVLQPDPCHAGGISEVRRIAAMAEVHYAAVAPHNPYGPVATAVAVHLDLACPNFLIQEMVDPLETPEAQSLVRDPLPVVDGHILPPTKPGLGIEVDEAECARRVPDYSFEKAGGMATRYYTAFHEDGSVADS